MSAIIRTLFKHDQQESNVSNNSNASNQNDDNHGPADQVPARIINLSIRSAKNQEQFNLKASPDAKKSVDKPSNAIIRNLRETKCLVRSLY